MEHRRGPLAALRWTARLAIPALIAAALILDARIDRSPPESTAPSAASATRIEIPPADALTSSWFCPVVGMTGSGSALGEATTRLLLTNTTDEAVSASVELRGRITGRQFVTVDMAPASTSVVRTADHARDEIVGALVEASSGGLAVSRQFVSPLGIDEARCSSLLSPAWHVPVGDTQTDAVMTLAIMNPLPRDAIVDVTFATEAEFGPFVAPELTGVVVPAWSTVAVNAGEYARRRDIVAASVHARTGRVAVDVLLAYDGTVGRRGFAAELASPRPSQHWLLPSAGIDDSTHLSVRVFNPSDEVAQAAALVADGTSQDRVSFAVPAQDVVELTAQAPSEQAPGPQTLLTQPGTPFAIVVESRNEVPLVVWAETLTGLTDSPKTHIPIASTRLPDTDQNSTPPDTANPDDQVGTGSASTGSQDSTTGTGSASTGTDQNSTPPDTANPDDQAGTGSASQDATGIGAGEGSDAGNRCVPHCDGFLDTGVGAGEGSDADAPGIEDTTAGAALDLAPVLPAESGLAFAAGIGEARNRWLASIGADPSADAFLTIMMDPLAASDAPDATRRVTIQTLVGETVGVVEIPPSGVATHRLSSGTTLALTSETPFAALAWQARPGTAGVSASHPIARQAADEHKPTSTSR